MARATCMVEPCANNSVTEIGLCASCALHRDQARSMGLFQWKAHREEMLMGQRSVWKQWM